MTTPFFWRTPLRYCKWASQEKPALFYSTIFASMGPLLFVVVPPIRRYLGDETPPAPPMTYPIPPGPRKIPVGFDDPE